MEKASRLRVNTPLTGSRELTRLMEAEALSLGIEGKRLLWHSLRQAAGADPRLAAIDFDELIERARRQRELLEPFRLDAATKAFAAD